MERLLADMDGLGVATLSSLPLTIRMGSDMGMVVRRLRAGIYSSEKAEAGGAVVGVATWVLGCASQVLPSPPAVLLDDVAAIVASRMRPALRFALEELATLVARVPELLTGTRRESVLLGLAQLADETAIPSNVSRLSPLPASGIPLGERPSLRGSAMRLAVELSKTSDGQVSDERTVLETWRRISVSEFLPEVRREWLH